MLTFYSKCRNIWCFAAYVACYWRS